MVNYSLNPSEKVMQDKVDDLSEKVWNFLYAWWKKEKNLSIQEAFEIQIASLSTCFSQSLVNLSEYLELNKDEYSKAVNKLLHMTREDMLREEIISKFI